MALVTLNQVKYYLAFNPSDTSHDEFLEGSSDGTVVGLMDLVTREVEAAIDNDVEVHQREVFLKGSGTSIQTLPYWPIISLQGDEEADRLANLQYRNSPTDPWTDLVTDEDVIVFDERRPWCIALQDGTVFPFGDYPPEWGGNAAGQYNIRVKYNSGYEECPSDIMTVVLERIAIKFMESKRGEGRLGVQSQGAGGMGGTTNSFKDTVERWNTIVTKYQRFM